MGRGWSQPEIRMLASVAKGTVGPLRTNRINDGQDELTVTRALRRWFWLCSEDTSTISAFSSYRA